jgi:integration host factor subunit beta
MTRSKLVAALARRFPEFTSTDAEVAIELVLSAVATALAAGRRVEIRGFGCFETRVRSRRVGRNPKTGEAVDVPRKPRPIFKAALELRKRVNYLG